MNTAHPSPDEFAQPARSGSAWLLSLGLHALLLIVLAVALRPSLSLVVAEPPREVGIVLAQRAETQEYRAVLETPPQEAARAADGVQGPADTSRAPAGGESAPALPAAADARRLALPPIALPGEEVPVPGSEGLLVNDAALQGRGRRPLVPGLDDDAILAEEAARRAAQRALGPATEVSVFGSAPALGRSFVFAIDRSKSTGGQTLNALAAAKGELSRAVARLLPSHKFQIIAYHDQCVYYKTPRLIPATGENTAGIAAFIDQLAAFGGTGHETAVRAALGMEPDAVFLMTDGGDPPLGDIQLANIRKLAAGRTTIHTIHFGWGPPPAQTRFLRLLAEQNGGGYTYVDMSGRGG
jgi:hypothetical protein